MKTTCKYMRTLLALYGTGELDRHERAEVDLHLHSCESCRAELARLGRVPELVRAGGETWWADVRQGVREGLTGGERGAGRSARGGIKEMRFVWKPLLVGLLVIGIIAGSTTFAITYTRDRAESRPGGGVLPVEQWPTFQQNMQRTGRSPYVGPETPEVKWRWPGNFAHRIGVTNLVVGNDGVMYIGMTDLTALNLGGDPGRDPRSRGIWQLALRLGPDAIFMSSYPTVAPDGTVYVGGSYSRTLKGMLLAVNPDGSERWRFVLDEDSSPIYASPALGDDGTVYAASQNGVLYALNAQGELKWTFATGGMPYIHAPALDQDGTIYVGSSDDSVYAVDPDGTQRWSFDTGADVGGVSIGADGTIYAASRSGALYALRPDGREKWRVVFDGAGDDGVMSLSGPVIAADGTVYVASGDDKLYAVGTDGALRWTFATPQPVGDLWAYITVDAAGTVYLGSKDHNLYAIAPNGSEKWRIRFGDAVVGYPAISADGLIYVTTGHREFSQVYAIGEKGSVV